MNAKNGCACEGPSSQATRWKCGAKITGWIVPGLTLVLMPKCPVCLAADLALLTGFGISVAAADTLKTAMLVLCTSVLLGLMVRTILRRNRAAGTRA
ncbi:MAG: hypothetical protein QM796_19215 [Chthoniobacteraceae bacterium]